MTKSVIMQFEEQSEAAPVWEIWRDKVKSALKKYAHGTYTIEDIEGFIASGDMLIWPTDQSIALIEVFDYPQVKCLHVFMVLGELEDVYAHMQYVEDFARYLGCGMISANGRTGWARHLKSQGWNQQGWFTKTLDKMEIN